MSLIGFGAWLCLLSPLAGVTLIGLAGNQLPQRLAGLLATASTALAFVGAALCFVGLHNSHSTEHNLRAWTWLASGTGFKTDLGLLIDPLSVLMMLIVSGVGSLIVAYSIGYMKGENEERRYFAYMALFVFSMLLLVMGGNLLLLLAGWGMVGLSSYLLIGFYQDRPSAIAAAKKAFVMNAFGDATMALALFLLIAHSKSLSFDVGGDGVWSSIGHNSWLANLVALGLLGGALAKSAQLPLQTWLPDAMEGPTPVSALIHAATMVTAGVYLIARTHVLFGLAPYVADIAAGIGAATLLVAGLIALVQTDIKRVIAYSTMSQIGYMFVAVGIGANANGMFHLMTHAFFKALLFLAAGIVIHALGGEQDMRKMGGLLRLMPFTWLCFWIGGLALVGVPPFAGFFSKDSILAAALERGGFGYVLFVAGLAGAFLTGLYTFRMIFIVFGGEQSAFVTEHHHHPHGGEEGPRWMTMPVAVLAVLSIIGGFLQFSPVWHPLTDWLESAAPSAAEATNAREAIASVLAVLLGLAGMAVAWAIYVAKRRAALRPWALLENLFYFDRAYDFVFYRSADLVARLLRRGVEEPVILGSGDLIGDSTLRVGRESTALQTGLLRTYVLALAVGVSVLVVVFLAVR
ncbi:MAG: NADH-quinone oxidoreductase subunit [Gaiellaceae bacterium]|nr:NADH-quinone oxidoreductase subunit [Gaiellaceae bacterium]